MFLIYVKKLIKVGLNSIDSSKNKSVSLIPNSKGGGGIEKIS